MAVTLADISRLRKMSGAGMMDCKNALEEAGNDFDKAMEIIRKKGQAVAAKRSEREASEGCVLAGEGDGYAAAVAVKCETDFVAKNADFIAMTQQFLDLALASKPVDKDTLLKAKLDDGRTVEDHITDRSGITGEKMELGFFEFVEGTATVSYIHPGNKLATIVAFNKSLERQVARDIAMQIAAMNPVALVPEDVPQSVIDSEMEIARDKARQAGKPENILDKIATGSIQKFYKESTLLQQDFVKDSKMNVEQYLKQQDQDLTVTSFKRVTLNVD